MPVADPTNNPLSNVNERLQRLINRWKRAKGQEKLDLFDKINKVIRNHPNASSFAQNLGFTPSQGPPTPGGTGSKAGGQQGSNKGPGKQDGGKKGPKKPDVEGDMLPGKQGAQYHLVRYNGKQYVEYVVKVPGSDRRMRGIWRVENAEAHGFDPDEGQQLTKQQFKDRQFFGTADEITRRNGGDKNPFKKFVDDLRRRYGGTSYLRNKDVFGILVEGFLENADPGAIEDRIRRTDWYQNRTARQREWELALSKEERGIQVDQMKTRMQSALADIFGPTRNWRNFLPGLDGRLEDVAQKIASGVWDDPAAAFADWQERIKRRAEKIEGTTAWIQRTQRGEEERAFTNRPEDMFERVRAEMVDWLGYKGLLSPGNRKRPERNTLWSWANELVNGTKSEADFQQFLRTKAQTLYPYLSPDEKWMERASTYKQQAEEYLGRTLDWNDRLLGDFVKRDEEGNPLQGGKVAMTFSDFEHAVKNDRRFQHSQTAVESASGVADFIARTMSGAV